MDETPEASSYVPPVVDESLDLDFGPLDVFLAVITLPLLFWALMYAVSGHEQLYATRASRLRVFLILLAIELVIATGVALWITR